jgi:hypothetical protein
MNDKLIHLICGFILAVCGAVLCNPIVGFVCATMGGIAKELYDRWDYGVFDLPDLIATVEGGVIGALIVADWGCLI